jgi:hypothetical protein
MQFMQSGKDYPKLAASYKELHKVNRDYISRNFNHNFCDGPFDYLVDIGKFKNLHLVLYHKNMCCNCIPKKESFQIHINKNGDCLVKGKDLIVANNLNLEISDYLISKWQEYNFIRINYDSLCIEENFLKVIDQVAVGYGNFLKAKGIEGGEEDSLAKYSLRLSILAH